jgi:hypothetical protein
MVVIVMVVRPGVALERATAKGERGEHDHEKQSNPSH